MAYEQIAQSPQVEDFIALYAHQEQTPGSFFGGRPVLHLNCAGTVRISTEDLGKHADFGLGTQGSDGTSGQDVVNIEQVEFWVTSKHLALYRSSTNLGLQIPYPTITIHAQDGPAVLLELNLSGPNTADEDLEFLQLRLLPDSQDQVQALYDAISACQELNPDPAEEGEDGEESGMPGEGGWITSENMGDFIGEDGEFRIPEGATVVGAAEEGEQSGLGEGAGRRRGADELVDGEAEEEAKWQRTG